MHIIVRFACAYIILRGCVKCVRKFDFIRSIFSITWYVWLYSNLDYCDQVPFYRAVRAQLGPTTIPVQGLCSTVCNGQQVLQSHLWFGEGVSSLPLTYFCPLTSLGTIELSSPCCQLHYQSTWGVRSEGNHPIPRHITVAVAYAFLFFSASDWQIRRSSTDITC